ncbi:MAG: DNA ligase D [Rhodanobacteraceae bacterium]
MTKRLGDYRRKRDFGATPEPVAPRTVAREKNAQALRFVVQLHHARHRHFDFRLEWGGTLRSWAVPKGPSRDPELKRLAIEVEDHPLDYATFEGDIPKGHYGAGHVDIWEEGTWQPEGSAEAGLRKGHLDFVLHGARLRGRWTLIRTRMTGKKQQWLLLKDNDVFVERDDVADDTPLSQWLVEHCEDSAKPRRAKQSRSRKTALSNGKKGRGKTAMPEWFGLQLAKLHEHAPQGADWLHEVKYDGYRLLALRDGKGVRLLSRNQLDWTARLPHVLDALRSIDCDQCALDGELVVFDSQGHTRFDLLQQQFSRKTADETRLVVFDLLWRDGDDLREQSLRQRKQSLAQLIGKAGGKSASALQAADYLQGDGPLAFRKACGAGLEGIISKAMDAPYRDGRTDAWRKCKCVDSDEFVILGYNRGKGAREALGALLLGEPGEGGAWRYVGRVGTGFDDATLRDLKRKLKTRKHAPKLDNPPGARQLRGAKPVWVAPTLIAEIEHRGRTGDKLLRQASFKGLRPDKDIEDLMPQTGSKSRSKSATPAASKNARAGSRKRSSKSARSDIVLTHPDRVLIDKPRVTKQELADFYRHIAEHLLPGLIDRPLATVRCPEGIGKECFFQKHAMAGMPASLRVVELRNKRGGREGHLYVEDIEGVLGLVQMNVIEIHPWGSTVDDIDHPDRLVFDLDPASGVHWADVIAGARAVRDRLDAVGLQGFLRTTGGKGLHVVVPLNPRPDWGTAKAFAQALARTLAAEAPDKYLSVATKSKRRGRIFIDYLRNARGATAVASYCVRARRGAGVATPLRWEELSRLRSGAQYTIGNIPARLKRMKADPWVGIDTLKQSLPKVRKGSVKR